MVVGSALTTGTVLVRSRPRKKHVRVEFAGVVFASSVFFKRKRSGGIVHRLSLCQSCTSRGSHFFSPGSLYTGTPPGTPASASKDQESGKEISLVHFISGEGASFN